MNDLLTNPRYRGILLIIGAVIVFLICALTAWSATKRWLSIAKITDYHYQYFRGKSELNAAVKDSAGSAAYWGKDDPRYCIYTIDPRSDCDAHLEALSRTATFAKRHVEEVLAFSQVIRSRKPKSIGSSGANAELIAYMESLNNAAGAPLPEFPKLTGNPPDLQVLRAAVEKRLIHSWRVDDRKNLVTACGQLPLLWPTHPAAPYCNILTLVGSDRRIPAAFSTALGFCDNIDVRGRIMLAANAIYPDRLDIISKHLPASAVDWKKVIYESLNAPKKEDRKTLGQLSDMILQGRNPGAVKILFEECLRRGGIAEAERLIRDCWDKDLKQELQQQYDETSTRIQAKVVLLHGGYGYVSFHLVKPDGTAPRHAPDVQIDNHPLVNADDITWCGTLVHIKYPGTSKVELRVSVKGKLIETVEVTRK